MALKLAIVGRPNVGKSTLFNRLAGRKLAIVDDRPGVTRDRRFGTGRLGDIDLDLIDTAGFEDVTDESLESRMRAQTEKAIDECDVALFMFDAREGLTPLDLIFVEVLRRKDKPVLVLANKAEGRAGDAGGAEGNRLGFGEPLLISAEHGEGMAELYQALIEVSPVFEDDDDDEKGDKPVAIAIVGRPNAGKSTLVNKLIGEERLLTGPEAGITRDAIPVEWSFNGRKIRLVDTAGLRRKARVQEKLEKLSTADSIRAITFAEVVLLVMDATHPFEIQDLQIADLVEREGRALVFILAKWDLIDDPQAKLKEFIDYAEAHLPQLRGSPVVALSAETGRGLERLMPAVLKVHRDWSTKIKTRDLNDWLALAVQRHPPPAVNGRRIKPKYMAQIKARPPTFVLFATRAAQLPDSYSRYLVNSLRESFDLPGVPVRLSIRQNSNPYSDEEGGMPQHPGKPRSRPRALRTTKADRAEGVDLTAPVVKGVKAVRAGASAKGGAGPSKTASAKRASGPAKPAVKKSVLKSKTTPRMKPASKSRVAPKYGRAKRPSR